MALILDATKPALIILVGPPGAGKSTWRSQFNRPATVISTDDLVEAYADEAGLNYTQAFAKLVADDEMKLIETVAMGRFTAAVKARETIIVDRTNMRVKSRAKFLSQVPKVYQKAAVVFECERTLLNERLANRELATGKRIPPTVVQDMLDFYEAPSLSEFHQIVHVVAG